MNPLAQLLKRSALVTPPNPRLKDLPAWKAPSFWAMLLAVLITGASMFGIDLMAVFADMGVGSTPEQVIVTGERAVSAVQVLIPMLLGIIGYLERSAPNFRLRFRTKTDESG